MSQETQEAAPRPSMPIPPRRRAPSKPDRRFVIITEAVLAKGPAYNPEALHEETGIPVDGIRRIAAEFMVAREMVDLDMIEPEDAIRMGSEALAASLRIIGKRHQDAADSPVANRKTRPLRAADLIGMRRVAHRIEQAPRPVASPRTPCPNCGSLPGLHGGGRHQRLVTPDEIAGQGMPNA